MTLEDFFTLTEMKDGLTALSRVEDLVTVMQKEKDCSAKNAGDASRQWIAVARTIAATENKDCLDLFIKLEGVSFIDKWLNDAQKLCTDSDESFLEESIITLLQALDKLYVNDEDSFTLQVWNTLKNLFGHKSSLVQDRARVVFNRGWKEWKPGCEVEEAAVLSDDKSSKLVSDEAKPSSSAIPTADEALREESHTAEPSVEVIPPNVSLDIQTEIGDDVENNAQTNPRLKDSLASSVVSKSGQDDSCPKDSSTSSLREVSVQSNLVAPQSVAVEEESDLPKVSEFSKLEEQEDKVEASVSSPTEPKVTQSDLEVVSSQDLMNQLTLQNNSEANENDVVRQSNSETDCPMECSSDSKGVERESREVSNCNAAEDGECSSEALRDPSVDVDMATEPDDLKKAPPTNDLGSDEEDKDEDGSDEDRDFRNAYEFSKPVMDTKRSDATDKRRSDAELDYGVDALEVARQVAKAVEREVDRTRCSSSSSEKSSEDGPKQPDSPDSINEPSEVPTKEITSAKSHSSSEEECVRNNLDSSKAAESTEKEKEKEMNTEKGFAGFDLNEEVCSDEMDQPPNPVATTISVVSASRAVTALGFPVAPLQFEGTLGWRGSAATSAFRPAAAAVASSRRNSDSDTKNPSAMGGVSDGNSTKQRQDWLDFDLNVAEDDSGKRIPASVEASPKRSENFKLLDLNLVEDGGGGGGDDLPTNPTTVHMYNRNGHHHHSPSPASSSSSVQPSLRNFDLNLMDPLEQGLGSRSLQTVNAFPVPKSSDASVISIMGTRVEINKRETVPQILSLSNGKAIEPDVESSSTMMGTGSFLGLAPSGSYAHPPVFGYNGLAAPPAMSLPAAAAMYGPGNSIPYFLDSRVAAVAAMPQIIHSASPVPPYSQPPFMMSMAHVAQPSLNGAGPSRAVNFDLNSGLVLDGGGIREMGPRQFFVPGPVRPVEENLRPNFQANPSSSGLGGKRKEPDGGLEPFQFSYKQQQPPWR